MPEAKSWDELSVGDILQVLEEDQLYEITAKGEPTDKWILKAWCFFGSDYGREITLYKLNREEDGA